MRTTENLNPVNIHKLLGQEAGCADLPNVVYVGAHVGDAAHAEVRPARAATATGDDNVRNTHADLFKVIYAAEFQAFASDCHDRYGYFLQVLFATQRRYGDLFQPCGFCSLCLLCYCGLTGQSTDASERRYDGNP